MSAGRCSATRWCSAPRRSGGSTASFAKAALSSGLSSATPDRGARSTGAARDPRRGARDRRARGAFGSRAERLPFLLLFGVAGLAFVQLFCFVAIHRLEIGVALLIQYVAPVLIALWATARPQEPVRRRVWAALILALGGLSFVVDLWSGVALDGLGVLARARRRRSRSPLYILLAESAVTRRDPVSLLALGFAFARSLLGPAPAVVVVPDGVSGRPSQPRRRTLLADAAGLGARWSASSSSGTIVPFLPAPRSASPSLRRPGPGHDGDVRARLPARSSPTRCSAVAHGRCSSWAARSSYAGILLAQTAR